MKKSLVSLSIAAMVLAGSAYAEPHSKGTHKGHVHKSVGESCSDKCDDLRRQIEDLNASYQERLQALETSVEELEEVAHEHETLLLDPAEGSFSLGFDVWWADFSGGETTVGSFIGTDAVGTAIVTSPIVTNLDDDAAWTGSLSFQSDVDSAWNFRYTSAETDATYGFTSPGPLFTPSFVAAPFAAFAGAGVGNGYSDVAFFRETEVTDWSVEQENRVWANETFALNWSWGIRHADIDNRESGFFANNLTAGVDNTTYDASSQFDGWGPSAGLRGRYYLSDDFEVQGNLGFAALVGDTDNSAVVTTDPDVFDGVPGPITTVNAAQTTNSVNPVLDLGSRFVWHAGDSLDVHVGYSVTRYFDAIVQPTGITNVKQDLSLDGIRAGIQWNFD